MSEKVQCIECTRLNLREFPKMAALGFGWCIQKQRGEFCSVVYPRDCKAFRAETLDKVQARVDWYEKRGKK